MLKMSWPSTLQTLAWDGTPWTKWAQGQARCPGPKALLHGRVRPHANTHVFICSFTQSHTSAEHVHAYLCAQLFWSECHSEEWDSSGYVKSCDLVVVSSWGWKHVIPAGEAWREDSFSLITLPAGWVCNERQRVRRRTQAMSEQGEVAHLKFCKQWKYVHLQNPVWKNKTLKWSVNIKSSGWFVHWYYLWITFGTQIDYIRARYYWKKDDKTFK